MSFVDQTDYSSNKTAGNESPKEECAREVRVFPALPKSESAEGVNKPIYATYVQQKRVVAGTATTRLSHI